MNSLNSRGFNGDPGPGALAQQVADLIVTGAAVWTGDPAQPEAEAVAIRGDRIVAVGSAAEIEAWRGRATRVIAAAGRLLLPGFNDAHVHFIDGGLQLDNVNLKDAAGTGEFIRRVGVQAERTVTGEWILGGGWDEQRWDRPALPVKEMIDPVTREVPVLIHRSDLHTALANSLGLRLAGVTSATPDPVGGTIVRDAAGNPTGILKDAAINLVAGIIPPISPERRLRAAQKALAHAAALGVTSVHHMNAGSDDIALFAELGARGELTTRIYAVPSASEWAGALPAAISNVPASPALRVGAVKGFADGSLGSATALFFEPYADAPETCGLLTDEMHPRAALLARLVQADKAALQVCWHAIGDRAVSLTLDLFDDIVRSNGLRDRRFRIEHAQHVAPPDFERFRLLPVIASVQPYHVIDDGCWAARRLGAGRLKTSYPYRTFLDQGVRLALGTDWYVAPLNPMLTLHAATSRLTLDGLNPRGWIPEQKLSMAEAVSAYTAGSAYAEFQEVVKGTITTGKFADLVLLDRNIFTIDPVEVPGVAVDATVVGGRIVYTNPPAAWP